jgi:hypothetical protein
MPRKPKPEPPLPTRWEVYKVAEKTVCLGTVEARDKYAAIEKAPSNSRRIYGACTRSSGDDAVHGFRARLRSPRALGIGRASVYLVLEVGIEGRGAG